MAHNLPRLNYNNPQQEMQEIATAILYFATKRQTSPLVNTVEGWRQWPFSGKFKIIGFEGCRNELWIKIWLIEIHTETLK